MKHLNMTLSAWTALLLALPVLWMGEGVVRRVGWLARRNIPAPVVGGLGMAGAVLLLNSTGAFDLTIGTKVTDGWWTWWVTSPHEWAGRPAVNVYQPFLVAFFTCMGLCASASLLRRGSGPLLLFLLGATGLAIAQNVLGVALARWLAQPPLLGVVCGSLTLTGGHGTALGFVPELERVGLAQAGVLGVAAATFGLVAGGLVGGPLGGHLIRRFRLQPAGQGGPAALPEGPAAAGILLELRRLAGAGRSAGLHLGVVLVCVKLGASLSHWLQGSGLIFPVYMGAMLLGMGVRNLVDLVDATWLHEEVVQRLAAVSLGIFLTVAMTGLNLRELAQLAGPMLVLLLAQVGLMIGFARWVTFRLMGRDYEAAVMAAGHCGFGLGSTANAVANMRSLVETFGPAPRAFLVVPVVGAFLIDFTNSATLTVFINLLR